MKMTLTKGNKYNVNGTMMTYTFSVFSGKKREMQYYFYHDNGFFNSSLFESELEKFIK